MKYDYSKDGEDFFHASAQLRKKLMYTVVNHLWETLSTMLSPDVALHQNVIDYESKVCPVLYSLILLLIWEYIVLNITTIASSRRSCCSD